MTVKLHRRTMLRGALAGTAAGLPLPLLDAMLGPHGTALANGDPLPKRLGVFYWGNGRAQTGWSPMPDGMGGWLPSENLQPIVDAGLGADVTAVTNLSGGTNTGCHVPARAVILAGHYNASDPAAGQLNPGIALSLHPSFDQIAADHIGGETLFSTLEVGVSARGFQGVDDAFSCSWRDNTVLPAELDPVALYERVFAGFTPDTSVREARLSVVDAVLADAESLAGKLGSADKIRLKAHLEGLYDLETRIAAEPPTCQVPPMPAADGAMGSLEPLTARNDIMADLVSMALACDLTRIFTFRFTQALADTVIDDLDAVEGLHNISHTDETTHRNTVTYTIERYADLLGKLAAIEEGDGRLLDQCAVLALSELTVGMTHDVSDTPMLVAGGCGGALHTGGLVDGAGQIASVLPFTLLKALDVPVPQIGQDEGLVNAPLPGLLT